MSHLSAGWRRAAAALLLAVPAVAAAERAVALRARPASLVLGGEARAVVEIDVPDGAVPWVTTNAGRIENLRPLGAGRFEADYLPPPEAYPQVAIIAVFAGDQCGWTAIPLSGRGVATARSTPGASVRVTIDGTAFGPVRADWSGQARVPVIAPPGTRYAFHRDRALDLEVPPTVHLHVATSRAAVPADAAQELRVCIFVVTPAGAPRAGAPVALEVTHGEIVDRAERAPGEIVATWRLPAGAAEPARATASLPDEPGPAFALTLTRRAGAPAHLEVDATPSRILGGEATTVALRVRVADTAGNAVAVEPRLETDFGDLSPPIAAADGWNAALRIPAEIGARRRIQVVARAAAAEARVGLDVVPTPAARLVVSSTAPTLVADGDAETTLRVRLYDRFGNPAAVPVPDVAATWPGRLSSEPDGEGTWVFHYRPERVAEPATESVSVRAGSLEHVARVELVAPERRLSVAPKLGLATSAGGLRAADVSAEAAYRPASLGGGLVLVLEAGAFVRDRTDEVDAGEGRVQIRGRVRYVPITTSARWQLGFGARQLAWASAGAGLAVVSSQVSVGGGPVRNETGVVGVAEAAAGWGFRAGRATPFLEARLARHADPGFEALRGPLTVLTLSVGCRYDAY